MITTSIRFLIASFLIGGLVVSIVKPADEPEYTLDCEIFCYYEYTI